MGLWADFLADAKLVLDVPGSRWIQAGALSLQPSGDIAVPQLPMTPGILLLEMIGSEPGDYVGLLSEHQSLAADEDTWAGDEEAGARMLSGTTFQLSYVDAVRVQAGPLDLTIQENRRSLLRAVELQAEQSGKWLLQPLGDRNALIPNPDAVVS